MRNITPVLARAIVAVHLALLLIAPARAQIDAAAAQDHLRAAFHSYEAGDIESYAASLESAAGLNPFSVVTQYNLACAHARLGRDAEALGILDRLAALRVDFGMDDDEDFASLRSDLRFVHISESLEMYLEPVRNSRRLFTVEQPGLIPEGIALDPASDRVFVGSMRSGDIYTMDSERHWSVFASVRHEGKLAAVGLEVDSVRGILWAVGAAFETVEGYDPDAVPRTGLFGFDLDSGQLLHKYIADPSFNGFNDVTVAPSGDIYLSGGGVAMLRNGADRIEKIETSISIIGSNGITLGPGANRLFVSSYPVGVAVIDLPSGRARWLQPPVNTTLYGIDGLYWYDGGLVGVQNGVEPWRLIRMQLDDAMENVSSVSFIEFANADFTPTTGSIVGDVITYLGAGPQPDAIQEDFPPALAPYAGETIVMVAPLN